MRFRKMAPDAWPWTITIGCVGVLVGVIVAIAELRSHTFTFQRASVIGPDFRTAIVGVLIAIVGVAILAVGLAFLAITVITSPQSLERAVREPRVMPTQSDPSLVATDPAPFEPHHDDSPLVAEVRQALLLGRSIMRVRSDVDCRAATQPVSRDEQDLINALLESRRTRGLGPLPPQF